MGRVADDRSLAENTACGGGRNVVLADVYACGTGHRRQVHTIVDDDRTPVCLSRPDDLVAERQESA
jgi:hypothetical protein